MMGDIKNFISCRLPGGSLWKALKKSRRQYKENPQTLMYRRIYSMNLRCYFRFGKNYHLMDYEERGSKAPSFLYHVTSGDLLEKIRLDGIRNEKTGIVFLTHSRKYLEYFFSVKKEPVLLRADVKAMLQSGYSFFRNEQEHWMWIAERIPPEVVSETTFEAESEYMI